MCFLLCVPTQMAIQQAATPSTMAGQNLYEDSSNGTGRRPLASGFSEAFRLNALSLCDASSNCTLKAHTLGYRPLQTSPELVVGSFRRSRRNAGLCLSTSLSSNGMHLEMTAWHLKWTGQSGRTRQVRKNRTEEKCFLQRFARACLHK